MNILCRENQWPADAFWNSVSQAKIIVESELSAVKPLPEEIEQMILRSWLEFASPAGMA